MCHDFQNLANRLFPMRWSNRVKCPGRQSQAATYVLATAMGSHCRDSVDINRSRQHVRIQPPRVQQHDFLVFDLLMKLTEPWHLYTRLELKKRKFQLNSFYFRVHSILISSRLKIISAECSHSNSYCQVNAFQ